MLIPEGITVGEFHSVAARSQQLSADVGAHRERTVSAVHRPDSVGEVVDIVRGSAKAGTRLWPISTGRNWGMGSRIPATDGQAVLDLGGLDRIHHIDLDAGVAIVQPGCSQRVLAEALAGTDWMLNVTASCADSSVVGNALERGDGTLRSRDRDILGVEVVLTDGSVAHTGVIDARRRHRGRPVGPDLTQIFQQSNLGVVTAMAISLVPRPERIGLLYATIDSQHAADALAAVAAFLRNGNPAAGLLRVRELCLAPGSGDGLLPAGADPSRCVLTGSVLGTPEAVALSETLLRRSLRDVGGVVDLRVIDATTVAPDDPLYARANMVQGIPTCRPLQRALGVASCDEVDRGRVGFLALLPTLELNADRVREDIRTLQRIVHDERTALMLEWNLVGTDTAHGVVQIFFDRQDPAAGVRAHRAREAGRRQLLEQGRAPYRSDIDHAVTDLAATVGPASYATIQRIKECLDPAMIIAPGHYVAPPERRAKESA